MAKLISNKVKKVSSDQADPNRYEFLSLENAEPDLGVPTGNGYFLVSNNDGTREWTNAVEASTLQANTASVNAITVGISTQFTNGAISDGSNTEILSEWSLIEYFSSKAVITAVGEGQTQISEFLITHDGSNTYMTEYGVLTTNGTLFTADSYIDGNNLVITATSELTTDTKFVIHETLFKNIDLEFNTSLQTGDGSIDLERSFGSEDLNQ